MPSSTQLVLPVGKLAISQFLEFDALASVVGRTWRISAHGCETDLIPLPHPSGASTWHRMEPGKTLLEKSLKLLARHEVVRGRGASRVSPGEKISRPKPRVES